MIKSFGTVGLELTMTTFNKVGKVPAPENIPIQEKQDKKPSADQ